MAEPPLLYERYQIVRKLGSGAFATVYLADDVREFFKEKVFDTVIPRNIRLGEAPSHGMPVILYDVKSRGAEAYLSLAREMLARNGRAPAATAPTQ